MIRQTFKNLDRRKKIYLAICVVALTGVFMQIAVVQFFRSSTIVSFTAEWKKYGKPVTYERVFPRDVALYSRFTVSNLCSPNVSGFVTADIRDKLAVGQDLVLDGKTVGQITAVSHDLDIDTGMFLVKAVLDRELPCTQSPVSVSAKTDTLKSVITVANSHLDIVEGKYYLWVIREGRAYRKEVKIGLRNGFGAVVESGLNPGDLVVTSGAALLQESDLVNIEAQHD